MRKTLLYLLLLFPMWVSAQQTVITQQNPVASSPSSPTYNRQTFKYANTQTTLTQIIPIFTTPTFNNSTPQDGAIGIGTVDSAFYFYLRGKWRKAGSGGGSDSLYVNATLSGSGIISDPLGVNSDSVLFKHFPSDQTLVGNGHSLNVNAVLNESTQITTGNPTSIGNNRYIIWCGDSYTGGSGASDTTLDFVSLTSHALRVGYINNGAFGGRVNNYNYTAGIPVKTAGMYKLVFEFGINDARQVGYTSAQFQTDYNVLINYALANGWAGTDLVFINISGTAAISFPSFLSQFNAFNTVIQNLATTNGSKYVDIWNALQDPKFGGYNYINFDGLHVNDFGHLGIKWTILQTISPVFNISNQALVVNGVTDLSTTTLKDFSANNNLYPLGVDSTGRLHPISAFRSDTRTYGNFVIDGNIIGKNAALPATYDHTKDWILLSATKLYSGISSTVFGEFELFNTNTGATNWWNNFSGANYNWYYGASNTQALGINSSGQLQPYQGILFPSTNASQLEADAGGGMGKIWLFDNTGSTAFTNTFGTGHYIFNGSGGTTGVNHQIVDIDPTGRIISQNGGTYFFNPISQLSLNTTLGGFLMPRLTTTQRDALGYITKVGVSSVGTGYTSVPTLSFSGGGGTGAAATVTVSGGGLGTVTLTNGGSGYTSAPTIAVTGGGGSGGTVAVSEFPLGLSASLEIYNSTIGAFQYFDGAVWQTLGTGSGSGTVTSVATGYGLSGGTITTTGTLIADTAGTSALVSKSRLATNLGGYAKTTTGGTLTNRTHMVAYMGDSMTAAGVYPNYLITLISPGWTAANFGISGDNTQGMVNRFVSVTNGAPEYVSILGGVNDLTGGFYSLATTEANLQSMYTKAHNAGAKVIALTVLPFGTNVGWTSAIQTNLVALNTWIKTTAINIDNVIDTYTIMGQPGTPQNLNPAYDSGDGKHPNTAGYQLMASSINSAVTFVKSSTVPVLSVAKNSTIDQDVSTAASVTYNGVTTNNLTVINDIAGSIPAPVMPGAYVALLPATQGAQAFDATKNALAWADGTTWQYNTLQNVTNLGATTTATITVGGLLAGPTGGNIGGVINNVAMAGVTSVYGFNEGGTVGATATSAIMYNSQPNLGSSAALTNLFHFRANQGTYTGTTAAQYGFYVPSSMTGATINKGFDGELASAANVYNLYMGGTATNYLNGNLLLNYATASKPLFTDASKNVTTTGPGTSSQFIMGDGSILTPGALTATNTSLTFSAPYNALTAQTVGLNLANSNTWAVPQAIQTTTANQFSLNYDGTNKVPFTVSSTGNLTVTPTGGQATFASILSSNSMTTGSTNSTIYVPGISGISHIAVSQFAYGGTSNTSVRAGFYGSASTQITASDNYIGYNFGAAPIVTAASGTSALSFNVGIRAPVMTVTGGSTVTDAGTLLVQGGTSGATNTWNIWGKYGVSRFTGVRLDSITTVNYTPSTSASTYDILTRNASTGVLEKIPSATLLPALVSSATGTLTLVGGTDYKFTGTTTTWTLPAPSATLTGRAYQITIKNAGIGSITVSSASGSQIYDTTLVATITITAGSAVTLMPDGGTSWLKE